MSDYSTLADALADPSAPTAIRVENGEDPGELLSRLDQFGSLRRLYLRSGLPAGIPVVAPPPSLVEVELVVRSLEPELDALFAAWPQLETLEVWGQHLATGTVPPSIARMTRLRELTLVSCGIADLPPELGALGALRSLVVRGCPLRSFPLAITRIPALERLALAAELVGLPDELARMTSLRALDLTGSLNKGLAGSDATFVNPVPAVIGRLTGLESLGLAQCGVNSELAALAPLVHLKRLDVSWGSIADLGGLGPLVALEELVMASCYKIRDLSPLARLPRLRKLDLSRNHYLKDASGIAAMTALEELDIDGCSKISSLQPILEHPTLKVLVAGEAVLSRWEQRQRLVGMPPVEVVIGQLDSDDLATVTRALALITTRVQLDSAERSAAFAVFGVKKGSRIADVPPVDRALARWGAELPSPLLLEVARMGLVSILDDLRPTVTAIGLLADRRAEPEQHEIARQFHQACQYYDSGHRSWDDTVLDHLIEDLFPRFLPGPLLTLLEPLGTDALSSESGDAMDALFVAALGQTEDRAPEVQQKLIEKFCSYAEDMIGYDHAELVQGLQEQIAAVDPESAARIAERLGALSGQVALQAEIEGARSVEAVIGILRRVVDPDDALTFAQADGVGAFSGRVVNAARELPEELVRRILEASWSAASTGWDWSRLLGSAYVRGAAAAEAHLLGWLADHPDHRPTLVSQLQLARRLQIRDAGDDAVAAALRATEAGLVGVSARELATRELGPLLLGFAQGHSDADWAAALAMLHRIGAQSEPVKTTWEHFSYLQMTYEQAVQLVRWDPEEAKPRIRAFLEAFLASRARIDWGQKSIETIAADAVAAAQLSGDDGLRQLAFSLIPPKVEKDRLAFNLACFHAVRGERAEALRWTERALALGKPVAQFEAEADFDALRTDPDFVALLSVGR